MYLSFFGLKQAPFSIAPDPRHLFLSERHREALAHLVYGLQGGGGFVLLTGEIGAGKTTLSRSLLSQVPADTRVAYVFNPALSVLELLRTICDEFGVAVTPSEGGATVKDHLDPLNRFLLDAYAAGRQSVLLIDEAQSLSPGVLEQLRLLTNLETDERKLLQIILIGQPELRDLLARPELEQLAQRVIARYHLGALSEPETTQYVAHRLAVAGREGPLPFEPRALKTLHTLSGGIPRRINLLADRALLGAYAAGRERVGPDLLQQAAREVLGEPVAARAGGASPWLWAGGGAVGALSLAAVAASLWGGLPGGAAPAASPARPGASVVAASPPASMAPVAPAPVPSAALPGVAASAPTPVASAASAPASAASTPGPALTWLSEGWPAGDEDAAWHQLAAAWGQDLPPKTDPCTLRRSGSELACYKGRPALSMVRQLDRPGVLVLRLPATAGAPARLRYTRLHALDERGAVIGFEQQRRRVSLAELAALWTGDFYSFWRAPASYQAPLNEGQSGPAVDRLATLLAQADGGPGLATGARYDAALKARVAAFQLAQGVSSNGVAGAHTFMQLNRVLNVAEPRLEPMPAGAR